MYKSIFYISAKPRHMRTYRCCKHLQGKTTWQLCQYPTMRETTPVRPLEGAAARAGQVHTGQGQVDLVKVTDMKNAIKL